MVVLIHVCKGRWQWPTVTFSVAAYKILKHDAVASDCCGDPEEGGVNKAKAAEVQRW